MEEISPNEPDIQAAEPTKKPANPKKTWRGREFIRVIAVSFVCLVLLVGAVIGYLYASTPVSIRQPLLEHYHFRMQILINGKAENFAGAAYQTGYSKDNCTAALPTMPIHFHDNKDQFVHIHWEGMTGGQVLKYYGWNFIGGVNSTLGYRFDELPKLVNVPIHGHVLPAVPNDATFYVYTGDEHGYKQQSFDSFTHQDLEKFFNKTSNFPAHKLNQDKRTSWLGNLHNVIEPQAYAAADNSGSMPGMAGMESTTQHASTANPAPVHTEEDLKRINNLLGNVVIFVQKDQPSAQQIKDRFNHLEPLSDSVCGG